MQEDTIPAGGIASLRCGSVERDSLDSQFGRPEICDPCPSPTGVSAVQFVIWGVETMTRRVLLVGVQGSA